LLQGIEAADSVTLDPHKWLYQPFETGCLLVRDEADLNRAYHVHPDYLQDASTRRFVTVAPPPPGHSGLPPVNFTDRGYQLTRSARALKVWLSIQVFGLEAFRETIDRSLDLALHAEHRLRASPVFEVLTPATLGVVCFRRRFEEANDETLEAINESLVRGLASSGTGMISSTRLGGRYALRLCVLNHRTTREDVDAVIEWLETAPVSAQLPDTRR
jgi:glutamate/tyrosine decarboxylase-like PLP-dependent enzyme